MEYTTFDGTQIDDEQLEMRASEYESGSWKGHGEVVMGRPKLFDEDMETISFRLPRSRIEAVEAITKRLGTSKSEFFRRAIDHELLLNA